MSPKKNTQKSAKTITTGRQEAHGIQIHRTLTDARVHMLIIHRDFFLRGCSTPTSQMSS
jgi:hypothetical protein